MKAKKYLLIVTCSLTALLAGCGTRDDDIPGALSPTDGVTDTNNTSPSATPETDRKTSISMKQANELAYQDAGVKEDELTNLHTHLEEGKNGEEYITTFTTDNKAYQYRISASSGSILEKNVNPVSTGTDDKTSATPEATTAPKATLVPEATPTKAPAKPASTSAPTKAPTSPTGDITQDQALEIAKKDAGVTDSKIFNLAVKLDYDNGIKVYEIEFDTAEMEYEYDIAVSDGRIVDKKSEMQDNVNTTAKPTKTPSSQTGDITQDQALEIAKKDAGVTDSKIFNLAVKLDYDNGIKVYEIEFDTAEMEYEYDIAVSDGRIVDKKSEMQDNVNTTAKPTKTPSSQTGDITQDQALEIAKKDAGVTDSKIFNLAVKLDYDNGIKVYEIEFDTAEMEYEYDIAVSDGRIVDKKSEMQDNVNTTAKPTKTPSSQTGDITQDQALEIAKKDAGVTDSKIFNLAVKLDYDNGIKVYEIEFDTAEMEYEYDIAVSDGRIVDKKSEMQDNVNTAKPTKTPSSQTGDITQDQAIKIARKDAGVPTGTVYDLEIKLDSDDGIRLYDIEFCDGINEYEYEISTSDGSILKKEYDGCDDWHHANN